MEQLSSLHTHILCSDYTEEEYKMFLKYGNYVKIVKLSWLFDCIVTETALPEEDYILRKYPIKVRERTTAIRLNMHDVNSFSFGNRASVSLNELPSLKRGTSISINNTELVHQSSEKITIKSTLFKDKKFYFINHQYKKEELKRLTRSVKQHSGMIPK